MQSFSDQVASIVPRVRSYALKLTGNSTLADDLAQDTALRALEKEHLFEPGSNLLGWMITICRNMHFTQSRKTSRIVLDAGDIFASNLAGSSNLYETFAAKEALSYLVELPDDVQHILLLRSAGLSYEEIATELRVPCGTLKSRIHRGRIMLAERIGDPELMKISEKEMSH